MLLPGVLGGQREKPTGCPGECRKREEAAGSKLELFQIIPKPRAAPSLQWDTGIPPAPTPEFGPTNTKEITQPVLLLLEQGRVVRL